VAPPSRARAATTPWTVRYRWLVVVAWLLILVAAAPFARRVTHGLTPSGFDTPGSAAVWADNQSARLTPPPAPTPTALAGLSLPAARAAARAAGLPPAWLHAVPGGGVVALFPAGATAAQGDRLVAALRRRGARETALTTIQFNDVLNRDASSTLAHATAIALPIMLVLLLLVFGSLGSAVLPLIVALVGAVVSLAVIDLLEPYLTLSTYLTDIAGLLALGVGVDYALFISSRFRQALGRAGSAAPTGPAVGEAMATAGRSVLFSGLAVALAVFSLALGANAYWLGLAVGGAVTVGAVLLATHTLLPALLGLMGRGVEWGRIPFVRVHAREAAPSTRTGLWATLSRWATAAPAWSVAAACLALLVPAYFAPSIGLRIPANLPSMLPRASLLHRAALVQQQVEGAGVAAPVVVAVRLPVPVTSPAAWTAAARLTRRLRAMPDVASVASPSAGGATPAQLALLSRALEQAPVPGDAPAPAQALRNFVSPRVDSRLLVLYVTAQSDPNAAASRALVARMPAVARAAVPHGSRVGIGGAVAYLADFDHFTQGRLPIIGAAVAAVAFLVLSVATGSILQALLGVAVDALVAAATAGILVLTIQRGGLGFAPAVPNLAVTPIVFVLLFGLSMDYEVILLHRIQEALVGARTSAEAARDGLWVTGGMITGAGLIMVTVFIVLLTSPLEILQTLGLGMAAAILFDTWIVRTFIVPGLTALLRTHAFWPWGGRPGPTAAARPAAP